MRSAHRFQHALATAADADLFRHLPVDWWDISASCWRPTVLLEAAADAGMSRTHVVVAAPLQRSEGETAAVGSRTVRIDELRLSTRVDDDIAQFFTTLYTLELIDLLTPCIEQASLAERTQLHAIVDQLHGIHGGAVESWSQAFDRGVVDERDSATETHATTARTPADVFEALQPERMGDEISCSPVVLWDEEAELWRPTVLLGATGDDEQFRPWQDVRVLVPGDPVDVATVPGSLLRPIDLADACFSLIAIPVLARDFMRLHDALAAAGLDREEIAAHPSFISFSRMLDGAADEWRAVFDEGLPGSAPEPRVIPLHPSLWGLAVSDYTVAPDAG